MFTFVLDYIQDGIVMYSYMPEGDKSRVGHVGMEIETGRCIFSELAPNDEFRSIAFMMAKCIAEFRDNGRFEKSGS